MTFIADIIEGSLQVDDGIPSYVRNYLVSVPSNVAPHAKFWTARNTGGIPALNEQHPTVPGIVARKFRAEARDDDPNLIQVTVEYNEPPAIETATDPGSAAPGKTVEISIDTFTEGTLFDIDGNLMTIKYVKLGASGVSQLVQNLEFQVERPTSTVRITEEVNTLPKQFIFDGFVGSINSVEWSGFPPRTWMLRGINTTQLQQGRNRVSWVFTYNARTWRAEGRVSDGGKVPDNASLENGIAFFRVYPEVDFKKTGQSF